MKVIFILLISSFLFSVVGFKSIQSPIDDYNQQDETREHFKSFCTGCHGSKMERFPGNTLHSSDDQLIQVIRSGLKDLGMPAFEKTFTVDQTHALVGYVKKVITENQPGIPLTRFPQVIHSSELSFQIDTVLTGLGVPWGMAFLPDGDLLVTERSGELFRIRNKKLAAIVEGLPKVYKQGQGGLLDIKLHPDFLTNGWIYISYAEPGLIPDNEEGGCTAVLRARLKNDRLTDVQRIFRAYPNTTSGVHFGCRMVFDDENYLYITLGERGNMANAQNLSNHCGKIHRIHDDGRIPDDNPFLKTPEAIPSIWSYGHRNPQGIDIHPETRKIWSNEHGSKGGDEINIIQKAKNYGWPLVTFGINYNGTPITNDTIMEGMESPVYYWTPSIGPASMAFVTGTRYPQWKDNLLTAALSHKYLERSIIKNNRVTGREKLLENAGRMRNVIMGPDGFIYIATENPGIIVRLIPKGD